MKENLTFLNVSRVIMSVYRKINQLLVQTSAKFCLYNRLTRSLSFLEAKDDGDVAGKKKKKKKNKGTVLLTTGMTSGYSL